MTRIYFDSNVYSNLRRNEKQEYQLLNHLINRYRHSLTFFFSDAHVRDKKRDTSSIKYQDFDFIESLTKDNYLSYHSFCLKLHWTLIEAVHSKHSQCPVNKCKKCVTIHGKAGFGEWERCAFPLLPVVFSK